MPLTTSNDPAGADREKYFPNYAGRDDVDDACAAELEAAGIAVERVECLRSKGEVKSAVIGSLHGWGFRRAWRYWNAEGPGIEVSAAEALHATHGRVVRVEGHCACPSPREWNRGLATGSYHIDSPAGLKALADTIRQLVEGPAALASTARAGAGDWVTPAREMIAAAYGVDATAPSEGQMERMHRAADALGRILAGSPAVPASPISTGADEFDRATAEEV